MKKLLIAFALVVCALVLLYSWWVRNPAPAYPQQVQAASVAAQERFSDMAARAEDPEQNGFLEPALLRYWGTSEQAGDPGDLPRIIEDWVDQYSDLTVPQHLAYLEASDQAYLSRRKAFSELVPRIASAFEKPLFMAPVASQGLDMDTPIVDMLALRNVHRGLLAYANSLVAEGQLREATSYLLAALRVGEALQGYHTMMHDLVGVALQVAATRQLWGLTLNDRAWQELDWEALGPFVQEAIPPRDLLYLSMGTEMVMFRNTWTDMVSGEGGVPASDDSEAVLLKMPGLLARELRIYENYMGSVLVDLEAGGDGSTVSPLGDFRWGDFWSGRRGLLTEVMVPSLGRAYHQIVLIRTQMWGLRGAAALLDYRQKHQRWPANLEQVETLSDRYRELSTYRVVDGAAELHLPLATETALATGLSQSDEIFRGTPLQLAPEGGVLMRLPQKLTGTELDLPFADDTTDEG